MSQIFVIVRKRADRTRKLQETNYRPDLDSVFRLKSHKFHLTKVEEQCLGSRRGEGLGFRYPWILENALQRWFWSPDDKTSQKICQFLPVEQRS